MLNSVLEVLSNLNFRLPLGVVGSIARNTYTDSSDVDIFVDGYMLDLTEIDLIKDTIRKHFDRDCDVIQSVLAKEEDEELDRLALSIGCPINEFSSYKTMLNEVIWCE